MAYLDTRAQLLINPYFQDTRGERQEVKGGRREKQDGRRHRPYTLLNFELAVAQLYPTRG